MAARLAPLLAIALAGPVAAGATIVVGSDRHGDAVEIRATAMLRADPDTTWRVLTDYGHYTDFIPDLRSSRVVSRRGPVVTVEQSGDATLWPFYFPVEITFEIHETPQRGLESQAVAGSLRALTSSYALTPTHPGTRLEYVGHVVPGFALFGRIEQAAVERNVARQFRALADEIERRGAAGQSPAKTDGK
jgi:ribosome-associated toxin RatA of RatAB toxin-antitoxin module